VNVCVRVRVRACVGVRVCVCACALCGLWRTRRSLLHALRCALSRPPAPPPPLPGPSNFAPHQIQYWAEVDAEQLIVETIDSQDVV
jgi:hypothetical protein